MPGQSSQAACGVDRHRQALGGQRVDLTQIEDDRREVAGHDQVEQGTELGPGMEVESAAGGDDGLLAGEVRRHGEPHAVAGRRHRHLGPTPAEGLAWSGLTLRPW